MGRPRLDDTTVSICTELRKNQEGRKFYSHSSWFDECDYYSVVYKQEDQQLLIKKHRLDIPRSAKKICRSVSCSSLYIAHCVVPVGRYEIEGDEDTLILDITNNLKA